MGSHLIWYRVRTNTTQFVDEDDKGIMRPLFSLRLQREDFSTQSTLELIYFRCAPSSRACKCEHVDEIAATYHEKKKAGTLAFLDIII